MKKINLCFIVAELLVLLACAVHVGVSYYSIAHSPYCSAPAEVAFFLIIPYAMGALVLGAAWLIVWACLKRKKNRERV